MWRPALLCQPAAGRGWPLAIALGRIALAMACVALPLLLLVPRLGQLGDAQWRPLVHVGKLALILGLYAAYVVCCERRRPHELSLRGAGREWCAGLAAGALLFMAVLGVLAVAGAYRITGYNGWTVFHAVLPGMLVGALFEEVVFRALVFRILEESLGSWRALGISALVFGLMHYENPGAGPVGAMAVGLEAGVLLGAAFMLTRRLWLCTAIHLAWNAVQGGIFSVAVSGDARDGVLRATLEGPAWLSGGQFGPEASIVAILLCGTVGALLLRHCVQHGKIVPSSRNRDRNPISLSHDGR
jgi:membrane protease YdiL (CAAX protease family)